MRLFIAEKPSLGRAIAAVLPGYHKSHKTHIEAGNGDVVVWCAGHILTQYMPEDYNPDYEKWRLDHLPIIPDVWGMKPNPKTRDLLKTIKKFIGKATEIVHAGDPDREGQLLVDEVIEYLGATAPVKRIFISDMNPPAVKKSLMSLSDNAAQVGVKDAALGRSRADWLFGLNLTRLYTLKGREAGGSGVLSVGRVQTPVLGLIVRRDAEIASFVAKPFYQIKARLKAAGADFEARWIPGARAENHQDSEGRVINREYAAQVAGLVAATDGVVMGRTDKRSKQAAPLPFSLSELQKTSARLRGLSPRKTLDVAQSLYEKHGLITYPRTDSEYLPEDHFEQALQVHEAVMSTVGDAHPIQRLAAVANPHTRGRCWNDSKTPVHHAIIPTIKSKSLDSLTLDEKFVYALVAHRYLLQFCPPREVEKTELVVGFDTQEGRELFSSKSQQETIAGWHQWRDLLKPAKQKDEADDSDGEDGSDLLQVLPPISNGDGVACRECQVIDKKTTPPKPFTLESLLEAMTSISRYVQHPEIKQILKETDGLGTPATQATIIDTQFKRGYVVEKGKSLRATDLGKALIAALPESVTLPDTTALWELNLKLIANNDQTLAVFMGSINDTVRDLVSNVAEKITLPEGAKGGRNGKAATPVPCSAEGCDGRLRRLKGKNGYFWGCTEYANGCRETRKDNKGKPAKTKARAAGATSTVPCERSGCSGRLRRISGKKGYFWGCTEYANGCRETRKDNKGKPAAAPAKAAG